MNSVDKTHYKQCGDDVENDRGLNLEEEGLCPRCYKKYTEAHQHTGAGGGGGNDKPGPSAGKKPDPKPSAGGKNENSTSAKTKAPGATTTKTTGSSQGNKNSHSAEPKLEGDVIGGLQLKMYSRETREDSVLPQADTPSSQPMQSLNTAIQQSIDVPAQQESQQVVKRAAEGQVEEENQSKQ